MRILLATYWSVPHLGGVWNYMVQLREKLESLGHKVDMLGFDEENRSVYIVNENRKINRDKILSFINKKPNKQIRPKSLTNNLVKFTELQLQIFEQSADYLGLNKYDVIHTQDILSAVAIAHVRPKNVALVATLHGSVAYAIRQQLSTIHKTDTSHIAKNYYDELEKTGATVGDVTIVANKWLKNILTKEFHVPTEKINVLHYGFDTERFIKKTKIKSAICRPNNKKVILYAGRLVEQKGVHHLITALSKLKDIQSDWECWIVGEGNYQTDLETQCKTLGLQENILFFGKRDDIPYLLTLSDIFVLPSLHENQPLSVIEAQIAGKAIIVSNSGGLPEIIENGVTGLIYPEGDTDKLCDIIQSLLNDENFRKRLGTNAKNWGMTHWYIDRGVKDLLELYHLAISKCRGNEIDGTK